MTFAYEDIASKFTNPVLVAKGGQKVVLSVTHEEYGSCILKIGHARAFSSLNRVVREVAVLKNISSRFYPRQYEFEVYEDHRFLILEEKIEGNPLSDFIDRIESVKAATALMAEIIEAIMIIWKLKIVHRDIKPDNIIISSDGNPRIIDLGIARLLDFESLTNTLACYGPCTPAYASPEQLQNRKNEINHRADQFSLGIVFCQMLLKGFHPYDPEIVGTGDSIVENIMNDKWAKPLLKSDDFIGLYPVISKMLAHEPFGRYRKTEMLHNVFMELTSGE